MLLRIIYEPQIQIIECTLRNVQTNRCRNRQNVEIPGLVGAALNFTFFKF